MSRGVSSYIKDNLYSLPSTNTNNQAGGFSTGGGSGIVLGGSRSARTGGGGPRPPRGGGGALHHGSGGGSQFSTTALLLGNGLSSTGNTATAGGSGGGFVVNQQRQNHGNNSHHHRSQYSGGSSNVNNVNAFDASGSSGGGGSARKAPPPIHSLNPQQALTTTTTTSTGGIGAGGLVGTGTTQGSKRSGYGLDLTALLDTLETKDTNTNSSNNNNNNTGGNPGNINNSSNTAMTTNNSSSARGVGSAGYGTSRMPNMTTTTSSGGNKSAFTIQAILDKETGGGSGGSTGVVGGTGGGGSGIVTKPKRQGSAHYSGAQTARNRVTSAHHRNSSNNNNNTGSNNNNSNASSTLVQPLTARAGLSSAATQRAHQPTAPTKVAPLEKPPVHHHHHQQKAPPLPASSTTNSNTTNNNALDEPAPSSTGGAPSSKASASTLGIGSSGNHNTHNPSSAIGAGSGGVSSSSDQFVSAVSSSNANNIAEPGKGHGITPNQALSAFESQLSRYEKTEIHEYETLFFLGLRAAKIDAPVPSAANFGYDDDRGDYVVVRGDQIHYRYEVMGELGKGSFGQVLKVTDHKTNNIYALKIIRNKKRFHQQAQVEVRILDHLRSRDVEERSCTVQMIDHFNFRCHMILIFPLHSMNLYELAKLNKYQPFAPALIKRFSAQLLVALSFMWRERIIHCDLKPENILLKTENKTTIRVIDFGSSCFESERVFTYIQSRFYRAPEIMLGLSYARPIDLWSLGCVICEMAIGYPIFPGENEQEQLLCIMEVFGPPPLKMIDRSPRKKQFFDSNNQPRIVPNSRNRIRKPSTKELKDVLRTDDDNFVDFVQLFLRWEPSERVTPLDAMRHPYIADCFHQPASASGKAPPVGKQSSISGGDDTSNTTSATTTTKAPAPPPTSVRGASARRLPSAHRGGAGNALPSIGGGGPGQALGLRKASAGPARPSHHGSGSSNNLGGGGHDTMHL